MKFTLVLTWANLLAVAMAFNIRGAAERAFFYSVYIMEEAAYKDSARMTIATGCVGSREGLRGQPNRCLLNEFMDYLWAPEPGANPATSKPQFKYVNWKSAGITDLNKATMIKMVNWIQMVNTQTLPGGKATNLPGAGYTGYLDTKKLFPTAAYYHEGISKAGESAWNAIQAYNADGDLKSEQRDAWNKWRGITEDGAAIVVNYRVADSGKFLCDQLRNQLQKEYGIIKQDVVRVQPSLIGGAGARISYGGALMKSATVTRWAGLTGKSEKEILDNINKWELSLTTGTAGVEHTTVLQSSHDAYKKVRTGC